MAVPKAFLTSKNQLWTTPWPVIEALKPEFNFTLDVAASALSAKAKRFYTEEDDAFKQNWLKDARGGDAWCNPPYGPHMGHTVGDWVHEGWKFGQRGLTTVFLLPLNKNDQDWYHDLVLPFAEKRTYRGRIHFIDAVTGKRPITWSETRQKWVVDGNSQGSNLFIFGPKAKRGKERSIQAPR